MFSSFHTRSAFCPDRSTYGDDLQMRIRAQPWNYTAKGCCHITFNKHLVGQLGKRTPDQVADDKLTLFSAMALVGRSDSFAAGPPFFPFIDTFTILTGTVECACGREPNEKKQAFCTKAHGRARVTTEVREGSLVCEETDFHYTVSCLKQRKTRRSPQGCRPDT